ncbi:MAG: hypothetical protein N2C14_03440, partial [Planctomycetales bacterium]
MEIHYQNTVEDFLALARRTQASAKMLRWLRLLVYAGLGGYFAFLYVWPPNEFQFWRSLLPPLMVFFLLLPAA